MTDIAVPPIADPTALGEAVMSRLPALAGVRPEALAVGEPVPPMGAGARAVGVDLGTDGRLVLVASPTTALDLQMADPATAELADACSEAITAAAAAFGLVLSEPIGEVHPDAAMGGDGETTVACCLYQGDDLAVTVSFVAPRPGSTPQEPASPHEFTPLGNPSPVLGETGLEVLHDVALGVTAELGRTTMRVREVLTLAPGSVIELDRAAGSPVDVLVNGTLIARGEVVVIDEEFGIRITEVVGYTEGK